MSKLELIKKILDISEQKRIAVKSHKYEEAIAFRCQKNALLCEYVKEYGYITSSYLELKKLLIVEQRKLIIDEIFKFIEEIN